MVPAESVCSNRIALTDMSEKIGHRDPLYLFTCHLEWRTKRNLAAYEELLAALDDHDHDIRRLAEYLLHRSSPRPELRQVSNPGEVTTVRIKLLEVVLPKGRLYTEVRCPHADNDRIAAIRTNQSPPRGSYINHLVAAALARNVRFNGHRESKTERFEDQANVSCRNAVVTEWSDPEVGRQTRR